MLSPRGSRIPLKLPAGTGTPESDDPDDTQLAWQYDEETDRLYMNYPED